MNSRTVKLTVGWSKAAGVRQHNTTHTCRATINRYGFNSLGADSAIDRLERFWRRVENDPRRKKGACQIGCIQ